MQEKIVSTQKELDNLIDSNFEGLIIIKDTKEEINIFKNGKSLIDVSGSAQIRSVYGSAQIGYVSGSAQIRSVYGSAQIGSVSDSAQIRSVSDSAQIGYVYGSAQIRSVSGSAQIGYVSGSAQIGYVYGSAQIRSVYGSAQIGYVYDSAQIGYVSGSAQIRSVYGSAQIGSVSGSAQIGSVYGNGLLNIYSSSVTIKNANNKAILICYESPKIIKKAKSVKIIKTAQYKEDNFSIQKFIDIYAVEQDGEDLILYKSVKDDYTDFYTGKIKYEIGKKIVAPDWDDKYKEECGKGLHLSPTPYFALQFNNGKVLKCKVKRKDCRTVKSPTYPHKVRCRQAEVIEEVKSLF